MNLTNNGNINALDKIKINDIVNPNDNNESTDNLLTEHDSISQPSRINHESMIDMLEID